MNVVLDTNVLVSAAWSPGRNAADILEAVFSGRFVPCYDGRILEEYERVLRYPKFGFSEWEIDAVLAPVVKYGISVVVNADLTGSDFKEAGLAEAARNVSFERDESDRKFYEVAKYCHAILITGNKAHFPQEDFILSPAEFCQRYL